MMIENLSQWKSKIIPLLLNQKVIFLFYCIVAVVVSIQKCVTSHYGVYLIYKTAALNLAAQNSPYAIGSGYLYSPTFAAFFLSFAYLPDIIGCILWNLLSIVLLLFSINLLKIGNREKSIICGVIFFEALGCLQNYQANVIATAFMLFVFVSFERNKYSAAAFCAGLGFFIKIFGVGFAVLFLFFQKKIKFILCLIVSIVILFLIPLFFIGFDINYLLDIYKAWIQALCRNVQNDPEHFISFFTILQTWFNCNINVGNINSNLTYLIQVASLFILALPLIRFSKYKSRTYQLMFLSSLLIWVVIFNPKAESPTYIVAMTGVAIWFIAQKSTRLTVILLILAILFTSLSGSDLFKPVHSYLPYGTKAIFCIIIWIIAQFQLLFMSFNKPKRQELCVI
jgi:hypothetical protein